MDFLHRLTTVHLKQLQIGGGTPGCFLTAQGKIRSFFYLWNPSKDHYAFEFDAGQSGKWKTDLFSIIDQYTFGEKIVLEDRTSSLKCLWLFPDESSLGSLLDTHPGSMSEVTPNGTSPGAQVFACNHGSTPYARPWFTIWGNALALESWMTTHFGNPSIVSFSDLEIWRIQAVQPAMDSEITESAVPLEIGLRHAIADNKGCYPGQEVIEKIVALGSPAKRLVKIEGQGPLPRVGDRVHLMDPKTQKEGTEIGTITTIQKTLQADQRFEALALLRKTHAQEGLVVGILNLPETRGTIVKIAPHV
jgi:folate-binding protein YgfZ